jgi:hypothetical protein
MDGTCTTQGEKWNTYEILIENMNGREYRQDINLGGR